MLFVLLNALLDEGPCRVEEPFLEQLAQARPDPGGGAAAAYACELGLALVEKVIRLEIQRTSDSVANRWPEALADVQKFSSVLGKLRERDCAAYLKLAERRASSANDVALESAIGEAVACPAEIIKTTRFTLELLSRVGNHCKAHLISDLQVACEIMAAAIMGSYHIAMANLHLLRGETATLRGQLEISAQLDGAIKVLETVRQELILRTRPPLENR
jgi:methenyltetrahydrofolate cyclohydrolase